LGFFNILTPILTCDLNDNKFTVFNKESIKNIAAVKAKIIIPNNVTQFMH